MIRIFCDICGKDKKCVFKICDYGMPHDYDYAHICQECYAEKLVPMFKESLSKRLHGEENKQ